MISYFNEKKYHTLTKKYVENETAYHFVEMLGLGSYGVAYLLAHKQSGKKFVLKRMKTKHRNSTKLLEKFQQEISMLKQIVLPNTPSIFETGEIQDIPFYIMDYIDGNTFEQAIFKEGIVYSLEKSLLLTKQLLSIVRSIHEMGIVHRDLRIPNILIKDECLFIIDFGLAAYINPYSSITNFANPKKCENHISDLYFIGHFLLFLLYSGYTPTEKKEKSWQVELQLPTEVVHYIERLLVIGPPFTSTEEALRSIPKELFNK